MLLLYVVTVLVYCYVVDALCTAVTQRRFSARVRALRAEVRANLAARGRYHV